ncbi:hypothetical protein D3C76_1636550 [compost metagenome]
MKAGFPKQPRRLAGLGDLQYPVDAESRVAPEQARSQASPGGKADHERLKQQLAQFFQLQSATAPLVQGAARVRQMQFRRGAQLIHGHA